LRKQIISVCVLFLVLAAPLFSVSLGYGVGYVGETTFANASGDATSGAELTFVYKPWNSVVFNPALVGGTSVGSDGNGNLAVPYIRVGCTFDVLRTFHHPFAFTSPNVIAYTPSINVSYLYDPDGHQSLLMLEASPFKLSDKDFWYEFFSPYVSIDPIAKSLETWGINLIRYTYFFK